MLNDHIFILFYSEREAMKTKIIFLFFWIYSLILITSPAFAITPHMLNEWIDNQKPVTIIDIRSTDQYQQSHIPGAINIPALICSSKKLPQLGTVVVYSDGLDSKTDNQAINALNQKKGIQAELLIGGRSAWVANHYSVTGKAGMAREHLPYITYLQFEKMIASPSNITLLDIREPSQQKKNLNVTDLHKQYPDIRTIHSPFGHDQKKSTNTEPLMVLIDNADGRSEKMAHQMKAAGIQRFVILAGGEQTLSRNVPSHSQNN